MSYAQIADLTAIGLPQVALGNLNATQINAALQNASDRMDAAFRARYGSAAVPLVAWDSTITQATAKIAAFDLMCIRGMKPGAADYELFRMRWQDAMDYVNAIQRQQAHPNVTLAAVNLPGSTQPNLNSASVVNVATGRTAPNRGW